MAVTTIASAEVLSLARCVTIAALLSVLSACGGSQENSAASDTRASRAANKSSAPNVSATAEEVAEEARGKVRCPARIALPKRDAQAPVDDVVGVRPGMTYDEAANVVMCTHDLLVVVPSTSRGFQLQTFGQTLRQGFDARFAEPRIERTSRQIMQEMQDNAMARGSNRVTRDVKPGQAKWYVGTMGVPGEERVISAAREEWFEEGRNPTLESVEQALIAKYGTPTANQSARQHRDMRWAYDPRGRLISETSPLFNQCHGAADPNAGSNFSPDCGVVVAAQIYPLRENPGLAQFLRVGVVHQAGGYEALTATELALQQAEQQRRQEQVQEASKNASAPVL